MLRRHEGTRACRYIAVAFSPWDPSRPVANALYLTHNSRSRQTARRCASVDARSRRAESPLHEPPRRAPSRFCDGKFSARTCRFERSSSGGTGRALGGTSLLKHYASRAANVRSPPCRVDRD